MGFLQHRRQKNILYYTKKLIFQNLKRMCICVCVEPNREVLV